MQPAPLEAVINLLAFATRPRYWKQDDDYSRTMRPSISAGALHPVSVLLIPTVGEVQLQRYNSTDHQIETLVAAPANVAAVVSSVRLYLPNAGGTILVFVADRSSPDAVYENSDSLIWRDAGALLQTLAITAAAYKLAFCPLGYLGFDAVRALGNPDQLLAVGSAVVGAIPTR